MGVITKTDLKKYSVEQKDALHTANLKNMERSLKMNGICNYKIKGRKINIMSVGHRYSISTLHKKWKEDGKYMGVGVDKMITRILEVNRKETKNV